MNSDSLAPGADLDWLVLHHVFDWKHGMAALGQAPFWTRNGEGHQQLAPVSSEIAAAWKVMDHLERLGIAACLESAFGRSDAERWRLTLTRRGTSIEARGETAPLAIARAALKAVDAYWLVKN